MSTSNKKLAVLIDADNAPADSIDEILEEIAKYGVASVKRIYGDWSYGLNKWKAVLLPHAIIPVQQFAYTKGKNATDMALVIDAMDLLYNGNVDGFCIVSSDSDFTRLASRIRESGLTVYGFGEKKTPESFRRACDKFVYIEIFRPQKNAPAKEKITPSKTTQPENHTHHDLLLLLNRAVKENADDLGWAHLASIGSYINKINPDFDARLYGFSKLSDLIKSFDSFEYRTDNNQLQIRRRKNDHHIIETKLTSQSEAVSEGLKASQTGSAQTVNHDKNKKQRGRPRKNPTDTPALTPSNKPAASDKKTKQRGRPKKNPIPSPAAALSVQSAAGEEQANQTKPIQSETQSKPPFGKVISLAQTAVDAAADPLGWARFGDVVKHLETQVQASQYGFTNARDLLHAVYPDWLTIQKIGRGERIRINKRFINKE